MDWRGTRGGGLIALGFFLARRGATAAVGLGLSVACVLGFGGLAVVFARRGKLDALPDVPLLASSALAFGVGVLVAFAVATRVLRRDEEEGIRGLLRARGVDATEYLAARITGLAMSLAAFVAGGSALVGLVATVVAHGRVIAIHTVQASLAAVIFGVAFAVTFAPVAMATLGARSRGLGYLALLSVLVMPELLHASLTRLVGASWASVCSIPGALLALRAALAPTGVDAAMLARSLVAIVAIVALALLVVRAELARAREGAVVADGRARSLP
jgi:hypothetical protein